MSLITGALKEAVANEKLIAKQAAEISALKDKINDLNNLNDTLVAQVRQGKEAVKLITSAGKDAIKMAKADAKVEADTLKAEIKQLKIDLKAAQTAQKTAEPAVTKKRGRPRKSDLAAPETYQAKDYGVTAPDVQIAPSVSAKGVTYEYV